MKQKNIRKMPKYMIEKIRKQDKLLYPESNGHVRFYAYLAIWNKELVKVTVAVKNKYRKWYCKQVAVHGLNLDKCYVKDMEYCYCASMGFRVGWHAERLTKCDAWYEHNEWYYANDKYYDPYAVLMDPELVQTLPEFKYGSYELYEGTNIFKYLRLYSQYPRIPIKTWT